MKFLNSGSSPFRKYSPVLLEWLSFVTNHRNFISLFISHTYTTACFVDTYNAYYTYNMAPYSLFYEEMSIAEVNKTINTLSRSDLASPNDTWEYCYITQCPV